MLSGLLLHFVPLFAQGDAEVARSVEEARGLLNAGRAPEALVLLERAQAREPRNPDVHLLLGFLHYRGRDYPRAQRHLEEVLAIAPGSGEALLGLGSIAYDEGRYEDARVRFESCLAASPNEPRAHYLLAEILSRREEFGPACERYGRAIEIARAQEAAAASGGPPPSLAIVEALKGLGLAHYNLRQLPEATKAFEEAVARAPGDVEGCYGLALVRMKSGDPAAALPLLDRALEAQPDHVGARYQRGLAREKRGDLAAAVEDLRAAVRLDASHKGGMLNLGRVLVRLARGRTDEEGERLRREGEDWQRRYAEASSVVDDLHETSRRATRDPRNAGVKLALCTLYARMGDVPRAAEQARKAAALRSELARDPIVVGLLRLAEGKVEEARANFEVAIRLKPDFPDSYLFLSLAEEKAGREAEASRLRGEYRRREQEKAAAKGKGS